MHEVGKSQMMYFQKLILCCFGLVASVIAEESTHEDSIESEISELKSMVSKLLPKSETQDENKTEEVEREIKDSNFTIISEMNDKLQKTLSDNRELLSQRPNAEIEPLLDIIKIFILGCEKLVSDKTVVDSISNSIDEFSRSYLKFYSDVQEMVTILKITDTLTSPQIGVIDKLKEMDHTKPIKQSDAIQILEPPLELIKKYSNDSVGKLVKDIIVIPSKSSFKGKPNIPSYFIFNIFDCVSKMFHVEHESLILNQKPFFRGFESVIFGLEKLAEDLAYLEKSDKTAPNTVIFFTNLKKLISEILLKLKRISKSWESYVKEITSLNDQVIKTAADCLSAKKDLKIFDYLSQN